MKIEQWPIARPKPYARNPRDNKAAIPAVAESLRIHGFRQPIVVDRDGTIIVGHTRWEAAKLLGLSEVPVHVAADMTPEQVTAYRLSDNKTGELATWDNDLLAGEIIRVGQQGAGHLAATGFAQSLIDDVLATNDDDPTEAAAHGINGKLSERFIVPPFSVLDARQGYWRSRKATWVDLGIKGEDGRGHDYENEDDSERKKIKAGDCMPRLDAAAYGHPDLPTTSVFDPVLAELCFRWFTPRGGKILDPFGGEATKGLVAAALGYDYTGLELRPEQVETNRRQAAALGLTPTWTVADAARMSEAVEPGEQFDLVFTSPPYYDLEVYDGGTDDGSTFKSYRQFLDWYETVFAQAVARLKPNRFLIVKVGDIRDDRGAYRGFPWHNVDIFQRLGLHLYNDAVLVTPYGSVPVRTSAHFPKGRKLGKTHQNVMIFTNADDAEELPKLDNAMLRGRYLGRTHSQMLAFFKGDPRNVAKEFGTDEVVTDLP